MKGELRCPGRVVFEPALRLTGAEEDWGENRLGRVGHCIEDYSGGMLQVDPEGKTKFPVNHYLDRRIGYTRAITGNA